MTGLQCAPEILKPIYIIAMQANPTDNGLEPKPTVKTIKNVPINSKTYFFIMYCI